VVIAWQVAVTAGAAADGWGGRGDSDDRVGGVDGDWDGNDGSDRADDHAPSSFHNSH
jgi:hypothetical protein